MQIGFGMNTNHPTSQANSIAQFDPADSLSNSRLQAACRAEPDCWTAVLSAFLVACLLAALAICTLSVDGWQNTQPAAAQPVVSTDTFAVDGQHTF